MKEFFKKIDQKLFRFGSPTTLGLWRIVVGTLIFTNLVMISYDFEYWFTEKGFVPIKFSEQWAVGLERINLLNGVTDARITAVFYLLVVLAALFTALGLFTKPATIALFIGMVTLHHRTPDILHSGDTLMRAWCFFLMISPCGTALSLDRFIKEKRGLVSGPPPQISIWPQRLVQYQLALIYFTTVWHKLGGSHWWDGTATWYSYNLDEFAKFPVPGFLLSEPMIKVQTYGTLIVELALASLVFSRPWRKWILGLGLLMHGMIEYSMNIPLFAFIICSGYMCFYDGEEVEAWWDRLKARFKKPAVAPEPESVPAVAE